MSFKPRKVIGFLQMEQCGPLKHHVLTAMSKGWIFYVVNQNNGRCYWFHKVITIPQWALKRKFPALADYHVYYLAHELAHIDGPYEQHNSKFMERFKRICPESLHHFELGYKPRAASAAGITKRKS